MVSDWAKPYLDAMFSIGLNPSFCGTWSLTRVAIGVYDSNENCLNPSFCGTWSLTKVDNVNTFGVLVCLNPSFCGTWSLTVILVFC